MSGEITTFSEEEKELMNVQFGIDENIALGYMERAGKDENGNEMYRLTVAGQRHAEQMIADIILNTKER